MHEPEKRKSIWIITAIAYAILSAIFPLKIIYGGHEASLERFYFSILIFFLINAGFWIMDTLARILAFIMPFLSVSRPKALKFFFLIFLITEIAFLYLPEEVFFVSLLIGFVSFKKVAFLFLILLIILGALKFFLPIGKSKREEALKRHYDEYQKQWRG